MQDGMQQDWSALERSYAMTDKKLQLLEEYMNYVADLVMAVLLRARFGGASLSWFIVLMPIWIASATNMVSRCRSMCAHFTMLRAVGADSRRRCAAVYQHSLALFTILTRSAFTVLVAFKLTSPDAFDYWVMFSPCWVAPPLAAKMGMKESKGFGETGQMAFMLEFESFEKAMGWFTGPEYAGVLSKRDEVADFRMAVVEAAP